MSDSKFIGACSECGKKLRLPESMRGQSVQCKSCRTTAPREPEPAPPPVVPQAAARPAPVPPAAKRQSASRMRPVSNQVSPDALMGDFQGSKVLGLVLVAVIVHVVIVFGTSFGYVYERVFGTDTTEMSKEDRVKVALGEATSALGDIAERHNLSVSDITAKFSATGSRADAVVENSGAAAAPTPENASTPTPSPSTPTDGSRREEGEFEKDLKKAVPGPDEPMTDPDDMTGL